MVAEEAVRPAKLILSADQSVALAATTAIAYGLDALGREQGPAVAGEVEGVHQLRVATRRLRAAIQLFSSVLHGTQTRIYDRDLGWVATAAGAVRNCDVMQQVMRDRSAKLDPKLADALQPVFETLAAQRDDELRKLNEIIDSKRYAGLITRLQKPALRKVGVGMQLGPSAANLLKPVVRSVTRAGARFDDGSPPEVVHRLRVRVKRLRYVFEMLAALGARRMKKARTRLEELQEGLGGFNDVAVAAQWLIAYAAAPGAVPQGVLAAGAMVQSLRARERKLGRRCVRMWRKLERSGLLRDALDEIRQNAGQAELAEPAAQGAA